MQLSATQSVDFDRLEISESAYWRIQLHYNQSYLGRCVIVCKRSTENSIVHCSADEFSDLHLQLYRFESLIGSTFNPDRFNYTQLGNEWAQLHLHAIPRYKTSRRWRDHIIRDVRWGQNPSPKPDSPLDLDSVYDLAQELRNLFEKHAFKDPEYGFNKLHLREAQ